MIFSETVTESCEDPVSNVFSFGAFAIEVRLTHLATYIAGGGEKNNLSSAQGFYRKASIWWTPVLGYYFKDLTWYTAEPFARSTKTGSDGLIA